MSEPNSVLDKALKLQSEVRRLEANTQGTEEVKRVATRVDEIRTELGNIRKQLHVAEELRKHASVEVNLTGIKAGLKNLEDKAAGGIPSNQTFISARGKARKVAEDLASRVQDTWRGWTEEQMKALPVDRVPMLDLDRQADADRILKDLRKASAREVTKSDVLTFTSQYNHLSEELRETKNAPEELIALVDRLVSKDMTLHDLTDEDIALLREHSWDRRIALQRKGA
ncbi:hypothetical protein MRI28_16255 [Nocardiopsis dassonvillei]|uniref:hypothetical protein n=1 Tax=Nocardiopsis dassonvillei TaxID=2014 RepID=UPI00200C0DC0|nr:hypothetical protein [Nocardiopsis dassonvillei]MCK9871171.1 hypothetical protein [Nocardiopsis dassonvillei]